MIVEISVSVIDAGTLIVAVEITVLGTAEVIAVVTVTVLVIVTISESATCGSLRAKYSWRLVRPSLSGSEVVSFVYRFRLYFASYQSGIPSLSESLREYCGLKSKALAKPGIW